MPAGRKPFTHKICPNCGINKPRTDYYKKLTSVSYLCKICSNKACAIRAPKYFGKYLESQNDWRRNKVATDSEWVGRRQDTKKKRYDRVKDTENAKRRAYYAANPDCAARHYQRRRTVRTQTPIWADLDTIALFYENRPEGHDIDHIIPIRGLIDGRPVSGLHVLANLQYLTTEANRKKYNRISENDL